MQCTSIHNVAVNTVLSGCESGIGSEGASDNDMYFFHFTMTLFIIMVDTAGYCVGMHSLSC